MHFRDQTAICDWARKKRWSQNLNPGLTVWVITLDQPSLEQSFSLSWLRVDLRSATISLTPFFLDFLELPLILYCYSHVTCTSTGMQRNLLCKLFTSLAVEGNNGKWWGIYSSYFYCSFLGCSRKMSFLHTISNKETGNENHSVSQSVSFFFFMWM